MTPVDYIRIDSEVLKLEISDKGKMLLGLIKRYSNNGDCLKMSNPELAKVLCCSENHIVKLLREISKFIIIENQQSRYRRIFYSIQNDGVDSRLLNPEGLSKNDSTQSKRTPTQSKRTPTQSKTIDITKITKLTKYILLFDEARKIYPGTKRGLNTEWENFKKKNRDWKEVLPLLKPAIERQIEWRENGNGEFRPAWKYFQTWVNKRSWEDDCIIGKTAIPFDAESAKQREKMLAGAN